MRKSIAALCLILLVSLLLASASLSRGQIWGDDFASYIMQAESILHGTTRQFVEHNSITINQSSSQIGPVAYPWGYPLILVPAYALKGNHPLTLKLPGLFFFAGFLVGLYLLVRTRLGRMESLLLVSLFAFSPLLLQFLDQIVSDIPFLFFSTIALWLMIRDETLHRRGSVLLGCVMAAAFFIRTTGILLLLSFLVLQAWKAWRQKDDQELLKAYGRNTLVTVLAFAILWALYALIFPGGGESYFAQYRDFTAQTVLDHLVQYFNVFGLFLGESLFWEIIYDLLVVFFLLGAWIRRKQDLIFILFFAAWMLLLITWPSWQGPRFIFPLLPIFIYFAFQGTKYAAGKLPARYIHLGQLAIYGFWGLVTVSFLITSSIYAYVNLQNDRAINGPYDSYSREVYDYMETTPADSVLVFFKPRAMRLMTGRDSIMSTECSRVLKGDYLVLSRKVGPNQQIPPEEIAACNLPLDEVLRNSRFIVYQIQK
jgi:4-amino-4-deoxy-L-arabinose transferase-like glycosyltransferase